jgi:hypothetical protein
MFFKDKLKAILFCNEPNSDKLFDQIIGYEDIKKLFRMALESGTSTYNSFLGLLHQQKL